MPTTPSRLRLARDRSLLALVFTATFLIGLNGTMVTIALPRIAADTGAGASQSSWIVLAFLLVSTGLTVPLGQVADSADRRVMLLGGLGVLTAGSVGIGIATSPWIVVALRAVQAVGTAMIYATAAVVVAEVFAGPRLSRAMGIYFAGYSSGNLAGPVIGGIVATLIGWRWLFAISAAVGVGAIAWGCRALASLASRGSGASRPRVDLVGGALLFAGLSGVMYACSIVPYAGIDSTVIAGLVVGVASLAVLPAALRRAAEPAIDLAPLRDWGFTGQLVASGLMILPRLAPPVLVALYVQGILGLSPLAAAAAVVPIAVGVTAASLLIGRLLAARGEAAIALGAAALVVAGLAWTMAVVAARGGVVPLAIGMAAIGLGIGAFSTINASVILKVAPRGSAGKVNGLRMTITNGGFAIGLAVALSVAVMGLTPQQASGFFAGDAGALPAAAVGSLVTGYLFVLGGIIAAVAIGAWAFRSSAGLRG